MPANTNMLECANGNYGPRWAGCLNQGSVRVRCPANHYPCNDLAGNGIEFSCWFNCANHGGDKECSNERMYQII